jgi:hypothetical protein
MAAPVRNILDSPSYVKLWTATGSGLNGMTIWEESKTQRQRKPTEVPLQLTYTSYLILITWVKFRSLSSLLFLFQTIIKYIVWHHKESNQKSTSVVHYTASCQNTTADRSYEQHKYTYCLANWFKWWRFWLVFGRSPVRLTVVTAAVLTDILRDFPPSIRENSRIVSQIRLRMLSSASFPIHGPLIIVTQSVLPTASFSNKMNR